jgi:hypothetical protein
MKKRELEFINNTLESQNVILQTQLAQSQKREKRAREALRVWAIVTDRYNEPYPRPAECDCCRGAWEEDQPEHHNQVKINNEIGPCPAEEVEG